VRARLASIEKSVSEAGKFSSVEMAPQRKLSILPVAPRTKTIVYRPRKRAEFLTHLYSIATLPRSAILLAG
jgi:hypothetical protein